MDEVPPAALVVSESVRHQKQVRGGGGEERRDVGGLRKVRGGQPEGWFSRSARGRGERGEWGGVGGAWLTCG